MPNSFMNFFFCMLWHCYWLNCEVSSKCHACVDNRSCRVTRNCTTFENIFFIMTSSHHHHQENCAHLDVTCSSPRHRILFFSHLIRECTSSIHVSCLKNIVPHFVMEYFSSSHRIHHVSSLRMYTTYNNNNNDTGNEKNEWETWIEIRRNGVKHVIMRKCNLTLEYFFVIKKHFFPMFCLFWWFSLNFLFSIFNSNFLCKTFSIFLKIILTFQLSFFFFS